MKLAWRSGRRSWKVFVLWVSPRNAGRRCLTLFGSLLAWLADRKVENEWGAISGVPAGQPAGVLVLSASVPQHAQLSAVDEQSKVVRASHSGDSDVRLS